jgi:RNA polymerase sigma factor (sigma-70 family)
VRAHEESTDLVQSVCREILQHNTRFAHGGESGFRSWLYRTAVRKIADRHDYYRAGRRDSAREKAVPADDDLADHYATLCTPSRVAAAREQQGRLEAAFDRLTELQREVVLGARMLGLSHAELATRLSRSEGAVRTLLCRALARLTELIADDSDGGDASASKPERR